MMAEANELLIRMDNMASSIGTLATAFENYRRDFQTHREEFAEQRGQTAMSLLGINNRLDKINGSIGRHEDRIGRLEVSTESHHAADAAVMHSKQVVNNVWYLWIAFIVATALALAPYIVSFHKK